MVTCVNVCHAAATLLAQNPSGTSRCAFSPTPSSLLSHFSTLLLPTVPHTNSSADEFTNMCVVPPSTAVASAAARPVLILVGGGHAHIQVILNLRRRNAQCILISDSPTAAYSGMLPAVVAGLKHEESAQVDLRALCKYSGFRFVRAKVVGIYEGREVKFAVGGGRCSLRFDVLSINVGSKTVSIPSIGNGNSDSFSKDAGFQPVVVETRPILDLMTNVRVFEEAALNNRNRRERSAIEVVVVGGGAAGLELAMALESRFGKVLGSVHVTLVSGGDSFSSFFGRATATAVVAEMRSRNISFRLGTTATTIDRKSGILHLDKDPDVRFDLLVVATGAAPHTWLAESTDLETDEDGWVRVERTLQCRGYPNVFAAGDCVTFGKTYGEDFPPKAGVYAVREGPILTHNLELMLANAPNNRTEQPQGLRKFAPQSSFLSLLSAGDGRGIGSKYGVVFTGTWVYHLKNYIDESWQDKFRVSGRKSQHNSKTEGADEKESFQGSPAEGAAVLQAAEDIQMDDSFQSQLAVLRRMDEDDKFRERLLEFVKRDS